MGFDAKWGVLGANEVGAPHKRDRIWIKSIRNTNHKRLQRNEWSGIQRKTWNESQFSGLSWWNSEPNVRRVADGMANRVDRLKAIGNGQVPICAATAWRILNEL
jgi:DNA (cytosine-5)-methyltransferase 1